MEFEVDSSWITAAAASFFLPASTATTEGSVDAASASCSTLPYRCSQLLSSLTTFSSPTSVSNLSVTVHQCSTMRVNLAFDLPTSTFFAVAFLSNKLSFYVNRNNKILR